MTRAYVTGGGDVGGWGYNSSSAGLRPPDGQGALMNNLRLHCRWVGNGVVVYCTGRITFGEEATLLFNQIGALLAKTRRVLVHLGGVEAIDAAGLGTLAELAARARTSGGEIKFCNVPRHISRLFDLTHLSRILEVDDTAEEVLAAWDEDSPETSSGVPAAL